MSPLSKRLACWLMFIGSILILKLITNVQTQLRPNQGEFHRSDHRSRHHQHRPLVTQTFNGPQQMIWNCRLDQRKSCSLKNGINFIPFKHRYDQQDDMLVADLEQAAKIFDGQSIQMQPKILFKASRLTTDEYFPAYYTNACLYLSYSMSGDHYKQMFIVQRSREDKCIYAGEFQERNIPYELSNSVESFDSFMRKNWIDIQIQLDLKYGSPKFVLDFEYDLPSRRDYRRMGSVAIRNFSIAYGNCYRNDGNECDVPYQINGDNI
ncbi:hypothetical protein NH340_JMT03432 [Sarcoptes scabiei]|uniref:Uncharacterized protein n=1 Tax=Sarcoptes scabiei TaxID=52283 RepID=A0A132AGL1_SARSC|nr:hypothetical protein QR98_0086810 [Sarcoptes scabiei]UXI17489.1 hypothetical protein NH340_JMT03432 [Sarcoptes scabiei]